MASTWSNNIWQHHPSLWLTRPAVRDTQQPAYKSTDSQQDQVPFNPTLQHPTASIHSQIISKRSTTTHSNLPINEKNVPRRPLRPRAMPAPQKVQRPRSLQPSHQSRLHEPDNPPRHHNHRPPPLRLLLPSKRSGDRRGVRGREEEHERRDSEGGSAFYRQRVGPVDGGAGEKSEGIPGRVRGQRCAGEGGEGFEYSAV